MSALVCEHGSLRRKCELCERDDLIKELEARVKELEEELKSWQDRAYEIQETINACTDRVKEFEEAGLALYYAGFWTCDRKANEAALWERLRDALDLPAGTSPKRVLGGEK